MSPTDPELSRFLDDVASLAAASPGGAPEALLGEVSSLSERFENLAKYRSDEVLESSLVRFARRRISLVDETHEYQDAGSELMMLSMVLVQRGPLAARVLKAVLVDLSGALSQSGVPRLFGKLLKRMKGLARTLGDPELDAWVKGVVDALPGD